MCSYSREKLCSDPSTAGPEGCITGAEAGLIGGGKVGVQSKGRR